jgi:ribose 5-phosphate isomerase A
MSSVDTYKLDAARRALSFVEPRMRLGLGTGSTASLFVELLGAEVQKGLSVICVPTSEETRIKAARFGIPLTTLDETPLLDLTIDGADELDGELRLIKGGGGALLREKIVATASDRMNMIEMLAADAGCHGEIRLRLGADGQPFVTDGGNYIFDCAFGRLDDPESLDEALKFIPGVVENGLFLGIADAAIIGGPDGVAVIEASYGESHEEAV